MSERSGVGPRGVKELQRGEIMRSIISVVAVCLAMMGSTARAQVRYQNGAAYGYGQGYYNAGPRYSVSNGSSFGVGQFGYGAQGAWNALSRRHGYDPVYVVQTQPQPIYYQPQPTLYLGGTGYQYAPTVSGSPGAIYRGY